MIDWSFLIALTIVVLFTLAICYPFYEAIRDYIPVKMPPHFCTKCGCAIVSRWYILSDKKFDPITGEGTQTEERYYICSDKYNGIYHYKRRAGEERIVKVEAKCD